MLSLDWNKQIDEFTFTAIDSSTELFQVEALLKTLQYRLSMIQKLDAENDLLIEAEDELANELEQQTEFLFRLMLPLLGCLL